MTTVLLVRRFLADYARNGVNLVMLIVIPVVFVGVAAPPLADAAELFGGADGGPSVEVSTASGAAGFLAALAMYFQVSASRAADRRLVIAGVPGSTLVRARIVTGFVLALLASAAALLALAVRTGIDDPGRVIVGTLVFAVIYLAIGAVVGAFVRSPVNGTVVILFIWMIDWILGPAMSGQNGSATRALPTHFASLWIVDLPSGHGGGAGDVGWMVVWILAASVAAYAVMSGTTRIARRTPRGAPPGSRRDQLGSALVAGWREWRRNPILWILLAVVPAVFILLSDAITPAGRTPVVVREGGRRFTEILDPAHFHPAVMVPIGVASLAALAGLFLVLDATAADRRLQIAGMRAGTLLTARLAIVAVAALIATAVSLAVIATIFDAHQWGVYAAANLIIALTYGLVGALLGPVFGRVSGVFIAFLVPFIDLGIGQSPMLRAEPAPWAEYLPGYGGMRMIIDGGLTAGFDSGRALGIALAWMIGLTALVVLILWHRRPARAPATAAFAR